MMGIFLRNIRYEHYEKYIAHFGKCLYILRNNILSHAGTAL